MTSIHAKAFRSRFWQLHIDSQHVQETIAPKRSAGESEGPDTILGHLNLRSRTSSRDPNPNAANVPFKSRIRPGMVVLCNLSQWIPGANLNGHDQSYLLMILSVASAATGHALDFEGKPVNIQPTSAGDDVVADSGKQQYLCAIVTPGLLPETYEINVWRHVVVNVEAMEKEVILEYDAATRYYFMAI